MNKAAFFLGLCLLLVAVSPAQDRQLEKKLDAFLASQFPASQPGCAVLVAKQDRVLYKKAYGSANLELNVPLRPDMAFNIASITKQFTAVAILQLVEQGRIALQDSVQRFVPDFPAKSATITIENLLTHTSGIPDYLQLDYQTPFLERWDFRPGQLINSFKTRPLQFAPGTRFSYSNSGYYLLGYLIEKVTGKRYQDYLQDSLLAPLGMTHTYFDESDALISGRVNGYRKDGPGYKNPDYWSPTLKYAAGGLISNVDDLLKWHQGLYAGRILKKETLQKAFTSYLLSNGAPAGYGYGWFVKTTNGIRSIEHEGGLPGFHTNEIYFPAEDLFIAILCNTGFAPMEELSVTISGIALGKPLQASINVAPEILAEYVGTYRLTIDPGRTVRMVRENDQLIAKVSDKETIPLVFQSETKFQFKNLTNAFCEFIKENGKITKFTVEQNGHYEWIRIEENK